jgi:hypothetical protein
VTHDIGWLNVIYFENPNMWQLTIVSDVGIMPKVKQMRMKKGEYVSHLVEEHDHVRFFGGICLGWRSIT